MNEGFFYSFQQSFTLRYCLYFIPNCALLAALTLAYIESSAFSYFAFGSGLKTRKSGLAGRAELASNSKVTTFPSVRLLNC